MSDQLQQELLKRSTGIDDKIPKTLATGSGLFLYSSGVGSWIVKTLNEVKSLLGMSAFVPYTGATEDVDLGLFGLEAGAATVGGVNGSIEFEAGTGYQVCSEDAGGYVDIFFPHGVPKTTGAGNPSLVTYLGNLRGYSYAVNDAHDYDPQEYYHQGVVGGSLLWHLHFINRSLDATARAVRWTLEASYSAPNGVETLLTLGDIEVTIPANTTANTQFVVDVMTSTVAGMGPAWMLSARVKRLASVGTAPSVDPVIKALHAHVKIDTPQGSHEVMAK